MNVTTQYTQVSFQRSTLGASPLSPLQDKKNEEGEGKPAVIASSGVSVTLSQASMSASASEVAALAPAEPVHDTQPNNPFASTILSAIEAQLGRDVADGSTPEELQSRLEAGLEGFLQGFDEAFEQLSAMSAFTGDVRADVLETKEQVLAGLAAKADELGLDKTAIEEAQQGLVEQQSLQSINSRQEVNTAPVEQAPSFNALSGLNALAAQENTFSFSLTTADGDKIEILASALKAGEVKQGEGGSQVSYAEKNAFSFSVDGELDEGELKAINDLLNQVNTVAESFFGGNLEKAFDQAVNMGFDASEIKDFSLKLTQTSTTRVQGAYDNPSQAANQPSANQPLVDLGNFMQDLDLANIMAESMNQDLAIIGQLADSISEARGLAAKDDGGRGTISDFIQRIGELEKPVNSTPKES